MKSALIIATYNWKEALELCLQSVLAQEVLTDEIIIADDGSRSDTKDLIQKYQVLFSIPLIHVWHPDNGFQLSQIRNKAIANSSADYIIQIDGDLILHKKFIKDHLRIAEKRRYIKGSRVLINQTKSSQILISKSIKLSFFSNGITNRLNALHITLLQIFFGGKIKDPMKIRGCNMSFWKEDFIKVNGYNEAMVGWGREDSELAMRFINSKIFGKTLKFGGIAFHIYHPENSKSALSVNDEILENTIVEEITSCANGLDKYF